MAGSRVIFDFFRWLLGVYSFLIFLRAIMSWIMPNQYNQAYMLLIKVTEPALKPIRRILPRMGVDLSPVVAILLIQAINSLLFRLS